MQPTSLTSTSMLLGGAVGLDLREGLVGAGAQAAGARAHVDHGPGHRLAAQGGDERVELGAGDGR